MKSVLLSIHPKYVDKILDGKKTIEVRKSRPKITPPFKCYIYMTAGGYEWQKEPFSTAVIPPCGEMYNWWLQSSPVIISCPPAVGG